MRKERQLAGGGPPINTGGVLKRRSVLSSDVIGRDRELAHLREAVRGVTEGRGGVAFVVGEAGIGKSRLAQTAVEDAEGRTMPVLRGRAVQTATPVAYRPLAEALCSAVRVGGVPDAPDLAPFRSALGRLVPEWRADDEARVDDSVMALAEGVLRFLRAAARGGGCLLVLEDLHWADPETLMIVEYLADNLGSEPALCLCTLRTEPRSEALELARTLEARRTSELLELSRLGDTEVGDMVRSCLDTSSVPGEVAELAARADGVPFLVEELLALAVASGALVDDGAAWRFQPAAELVVPLTFADSVRRRLAPLGDEIRSVLFAAAVLGRRFDWELLPVIAALSEERVLDALHAAVEAQIVAGEGDGPAFRFRHALSRDAVLAELLPPQRAALSRRALDAIEGAHAGLSGDWCELAADLAERAGDRQRATTLLLEVGRRALEAGALGSAEAALERARSLCPPETPRMLDVEELLLDALALAGKGDRAVEVGESLLSRLGGEMPGAARRAETHLRLVRAAVAATQWQEARRRLELARADANDAYDEVLTARVDAVGAQALIMEDPEEAASLARLALESAERLRLPEVACEALEILGRCARPRDLESAEAAFRQGYETAEAHGLTVWRMRALHELGTIDLLRGAPFTRLEEARALALHHGALATAAVLDVQLAAALIMQDDPEPATVPARRGAELAARYGLDQTLAAAIAFEGHVHARAGRRDEMERCIRAARAHGAGMADVEVVTELAAVYLGFVEEDRAAVRRHLQRAVAPSAGAPDLQSGPVSGVWTLIQVLDGHDAVLPDNAPEPVHLIGRAYLRYARAVAAGREGDAVLALALLAEGDRELRDLEWNRQQARRLVAEAAITDGWGDPVAWLREALAFFDQRGEERIASACRALLRKAGAPVPRRRGDAPVPPPLRGLGITARELEVLHLVAKGLANKEIGARLYLSPRTVERHVANLTVKAGVTRRAELVAYAARLLGGSPVAE
jgi:DNA-binding CsgD family transcriptional regulator